MILFSFLIISHRCGSKKSSYFFFLIVTETINFWPQNATTNGGWGTRTGDLSAQSPGLYHCASTRTQCLEQIYKNNIQPYQPQFYCMKVEVEESQLHSLSMMNLQRYFSFYTMILWMLPKYRFDLWTTVLNIGVASIRIQCLLRFLFLGSPVRTWQSIWMMLLESYCIWICIVIAKEIVVRVTKQNLLMDIVLARMC